MTPNIRSIPFIFPPPLFVFLLNANFRVIFYLRSRHRHIVVKNIVATTWQWGPFCCDNATMSQQLSCSWKWPTIAFLSDNFPKNLEFCPYQITTSKNSIPRSQISPIWGQIPAYLVALQCLGFWRNYVKNITKPLQTSKISRIIYCHHCCHSYCCDNIVVDLNVVVVTMLWQSYD